MSLRVRVETLSRIYRHASEAIVGDIAEAWTKEEIGLFLKATAGEASISDQEREEVEHLTQDMKSRIRKEVECGKRNRHANRWRY